MAGREEARFELESIKQAEDYLAKHNIQELFNDLCASIAFHRPEDIRQFAITELEKKNFMFFEEEEIEAVFSLADLMGVGTISVSQAKQGLGSLCNTKSQNDMIDGLEFSSERVNLAEFKEKVGLLFNWKQA